MERLGIIGGSAFLEGLPPGGTEEMVVPTDRGDVMVHAGDRFVFIRRHGHTGYRHPHQVTHHANALALERMGVRHAVGLGSVGSLRAALVPGTAVVPDDYLSLHPPPTFAAADRLHIVPGLDPELRSRLLDAAGATDGPVHDGGVYAETRGPRFETRAEIRLLADYADMVGMTCASEATLLQERGVACAILGLVDNHAHGLGVEPLTLETFDASVRANAARARAILDALVRGWGP